jgi:nicotinate-nucleotide pyrophosphorylase
MRAIPEGRVVHPNVPIAVIEGPIIQAQLIESSLLNHMNFQTLIATKLLAFMKAVRGKQSWNSVCVEHRKKQPTRAPGLLSLVVLTALRTWVSAVCWELNPVAPTLTV